MFFEFLHFENYNPKNEVNVSTLKKIIFFKLYWEENSTLQLDMMLHKRGSYLAVETLAVADILTCYWWNVTKGDFCFHSCGASDHLWVESNTFGR